MAQKVYVKYQSRDGKEYGSAEAHPFCQIRRAVVPGHPTDVFVLELPIFDAKKYPSVIAATRGSLIIHAEDFNTLVVLLEELGMAHCFDEPLKVTSGLVDKDGQAVSDVKITGLSVEGGKGQVVRMLPKGVSAEDYAKAAPPPVEDPMASADKVCEELKHLVGGERIWPIGGLDALDEQARHGVQMLGLPEEDVDAKSKEQQEEVTSCRSCSQPPGVIALCLRPCPCQCHTTPAPTA